MPSKNKQAKEIPKKDSSRKQKSKRNQTVSPSSSSKLNLETPSKGRTQKDATEKVPTLIEDAETTHNSPIAISLVHLDCILLDATTSESYSNLIPPSNLRPFLPPPGKSLAQSNRAVPRTETERALPPTPRPGNEIPVVGPGISGSVARPVTLAKTKALPKKLLPKFRPSPSFANALPPPPTTPPQQKQQHPQRPALLKTAELPKKLLPKARHLPSLTSILPPANSQKEAQSYSKTASHSKQKPTPKPTSSQSPSPSSSPSPSNLPPTHHTTPHDIHMATLQSQYHTLPPAAKQAQEKWAQKQLKDNIPPCPAGYEWKRGEEGYKCEGGHHFVSDALLVEGRGGYMFWDWGWVGGWRWVGPFYGGGGFGGFGGGGKGGKDLGGKGN